jgi:hypothetical protein
MVAPSLASQAVSSIIKDLVELIVPRDRITIVVGVDRVELDNVMCGLGSYNLPEVECLMVTMVN